MRKNKPATHIGSTDTSVVGVITEALQASTLDHGRIARAVDSLKAVQARIDQAYGHICTDLPEINKGILLTIQQAAEILDSLSITGSSGRIGALTERLEEFLNSLDVQAGHMTRSLAQSLEILEHIDRDYQRSLILLESSFPPRSSADSILADGFSAFAAARNDLRHILEKSCLAQSEYQEMVRSGRDTVLPSLACSLNSVTDILRDLVSRSNIVKNPILKIMSGLQTHDIVNQDITAIVLGLQKMLRPVEITGGTGEKLDSLLFQEKASLLAQDLIVRLAGVIRTHGRDLEREIRIIENMIRSAKEDKDAISDFLLLKCYSKSTFDIVSQEITCMIEDLSSAFDSLADLVSLQKATVSRMASVCEDLERIAEDRSCGGTEIALLESISGLRVQVESLARVIWHATGVSGHMEITGEFSRIRVVASHNLDDIRRLMIESMEGIDICAARCLDSIERFKQDIEDLLKTLTGSEIILDDLRRFSQCISSILDEVGRHIPSYDQSLGSQEFRDIIHRLEHPHSDHLSSGDEAERKETGLTLF